MKQWIVAVLALSVGSPIPAPECLVKGVIKKSSFHKQTAPPPGLEAPSFPDRFNLEIKVSESTYLRGAQNQKCSDLFPPGKTASINVYQGTANPGDIFSPGWKIEGEVAKRYDTFFLSYKLLKK